MLFKWSMRGTKQSIRSCGLDMIQNNFYKLLKSQTSFNLTPFSFLKTTPQSS
jgi:hypothetical protein